MDLRGRLRPGADARLLDCAHHDCLLRFGSRGSGLFPTRIPLRASAPATLERVQTDKIDGEQLGVRSTPSFFIDGEPVVLEAWGDLEAAIEKAAIEKAVNG